MKFSTSISLVSGAMKLSACLSKISLALILGLIVISCSSEDYYVSLSIDQVDASMAGEEIEFTVSSNVNWALGVTDTWAKVNRTSGKEDMTVKLTIEGNYSGEERSTTLFVSSGDLLKNVTITQRSLDFSLNVDEIVFDLAGTPQILTVTSNYRWELSIPEGMDWCQADVLSGDGNADIKLTPAAYNEDVLRKGTIVFTCGQKKVEVLVRQVTDKLYADGESVVYQEFTASDATLPVNLIITGDGFVEADYMMGGAFDVAAEKAITAFFKVEPFPTYEEYFTVYKLAAYSKERGAIVKQDFYDGSVYKQVRNTVFSCTLEGGESTGISCDYNKVFEYAVKVPGVEKEDLPHTTVIVIINLDAYAGTANMWATGEGIAMCPTGKVFSEIVYHEGGGHAFAKLYDEYIYYDGDYPAEDIQTLEDYRKGDPWNFGANLSVTDNRNEVHWKHYFTMAGFEMVGLYEGGDRYAKGVWRPEANSCMNNNVPYFNAPSREAIVRRIMDVNGKGFTYDEFYAKDKIILPPTVRSAADKRPLGKPVLMPAR